MEDIPEGSGGEEPPEEPQQMALWDERVRIQQERKMMLFAQATNKTGEGQTRKKKRRQLFHDYTVANCEEAWGYSSAKGDSLGR